MKKLTLLWILLAGAAAYAATASPPITLTLHEGTNLSVARASTDGAIAFDVQGTLFLMPATGGSAKALTDGLGDDRQPSWSPDGQRIAFQSFRDGNFHIWSIKRDGTDLTQHTKGRLDYREPSWSPDGKTILCSSDRTGNYDLWELTLATGELRQLTNDAAHETHPAYAPDGKTIAYASTRGDTPGIYVRDAAGARTLVAPAVTATAPSWSPDGTQLVFQSATPGKTALSAVVVATKEVTLLSSPGEDVFPFRASWINNTSFVYAADGLIKQGGLGAGSAATSIPFTAHLDVAKAVVTPRTYDYNPGAPRPVRGIRSPALSPDGKQIVFGALGDLWLLTIGNPKPVQLTNDIFLENDPIWAPDGKSIVYSADKVRGGFDLFRMDLATRAVEALTATPEDETLPAWLPKGDKIAFLSIIPGVQPATLQVLDLSTRSLRTVQRALFQPSKPAWSPDGRMISLSTLHTYSSRFREGVNDITHVAADGSGLRYDNPFPDDAGGVRGRSGPAWAPDGGKVVFVKDNALWVVKAGDGGQLTGAPKVLFDAPADSPSWSDDSKNVLVMATNQLTLIDADTGAAKPVPIQLTWSIPEEAKSVVIHAGRVFDGLHPEALVNVDVLLSGNRIVKIQPHGGPVPAGSTFIDASTQTLMPGLFERHGHFWYQAGEKLGRLWLGYGITAVREPTTDPWSAWDNTESFLAQRRPGPFHFFGGPMVDGTRVYYGQSTSILTETALAREMERANALGYDMIKTYVRLPDLLQQKVIAYAHTHNMTVSSHEIYPAARFGVDAVEHLGATSRRGYSPKTSALGKAYDDVIQIISKSQMVITPTLSLTGGFPALTATDDTVFKTPQFEAFFPEVQRESMLAAAKTGGRGDGRTANYANSRAFLKKLFDAGARIAAGTDAPFIPFGMTLHVELWNYVESGLTPFQALQTATIKAAESVHVQDQLGSIEPGKIANLIAVDGNPLENIRDTIRIRQVWLNGRHHTLESLMQFPAQ